MTTNYSDQELASMSGPRPLQEVGSVEWCWQTVSALQHMWQSLHLSYEHYITILNEAEEEAIWEKIPPDNPYGSKAAMLKQVEVGESKDAQKRMRMQTLAVQARALQKSGQPAARQKSTGGSDGYLLRRLARDYPHMLQRIIDGEFDSAAAAAREAGIALAQPKKTVTLSNNVERVADTISGYYSMEQLQRIVERLTLATRSGRDLDSAQAEDDNL